MSAEDDILRKTSNRYYPLPQGQWQSYQEWHDVVMLHWKVPAAQIQECLPPGLELDTFDGSAWVSWLAFTVKKMRPRNLPSLPLVSNFYEVNLRTYVLRDGLPGIYLLSVEADKIFNVWLNRLMTGIPYVKSGIRRDEGQVQTTNNDHHFRAFINFAFTEPLEQKDGLDTWLTERHCLYITERAGLYRYDIHHKEWKLYNVIASAFAIRYRFGSLVIGKSFAGRKHFAKKIKVLLWKRTKVS